MNGVILNGDVDSQKFVQESDVYLTIFAREHPNSNFWNYLGKTASHQIVQLTTQMGNQPNS